MRPSCVLSFSSGTIEPIYIRIVLCIPRGQTRGQRRSNQAYLPPGRRLDSNLVDACVRASIASILRVSVLVYSSSGTTTVNPPTSELPCQDVIRAQHPSQPVLLGQNHSFQPSWDYFKGGSCFAAGSGRPFDYNLAHACEHACVHSCLLLVPHSQARSCVLLFLDY